MRRWHHQLTNLHIYSYRLVKKHFLKICETSKCHTCKFLISQPIFIRFSLFCFKIFTLSSEIKLILLWISSLITLSPLPPPTCYPLGVQMAPPWELSSHTIYSSPKMIRNITWLFYGWIWKRLGLKFTVLGPWGPSPRYPMGVHYNMYM